jgi:hypothetical protein
MQSMGWFLISQLIGVEPLRSQKCLKLLCPLPFLLCPSPFLFCPLPFLFCPLLF